MAAAEHATDRRSDDRLSLLTVAAMRPGALALRHKYRGEWLDLSWRAVVRIVDVLSTVFAGLGLDAGDRLALAGEITPGLLLAGLAAEALGAEFQAVPPGAKTADVLAAVATHPPRIALIQGRNSLAVWLQVRSYLPDLRIIFDHAAPGAHQDKSILHYSDLLTDTAPAHGWAERLPGRGHSASRSEILWVEASTAWPGSLTTIIDRWLRSGTALALPELLSAAARDRAEIRPTHWLASDATLRNSAQDIANRLPRRLTGASATGSRPLYHRPLAQLARKRLGLSNLSAIAAESANAAPFADAVAVFASLGIPVHAAAQPDGDRISGPAPLKPHVPFLAAEGLS